MNTPDFNLLLTLDALLDEGSVAGAARRLSLSPSAMSRALARLRETTGDPLLVRAGRGLVPTPRALALRTQVSQLVQEAHAVLRPQQEIDPARLVRTFRLRSSDGFVEAVGPALLARLAAEAPGVRLHFLAKPDKGSRPLRSGELDFETGVIGAETAPELRTQALFQDHFVAVVRPGHPLCEGTLTAARYAAARHIMVSRRGLEQGPIDEALARLGLAREAATLVPGFATALALVRGSDLVATVPERHFAALHADSVTLPLPFPLAGIRVALIGTPVRTPTRLTAGCAPSSARPAPGPPMEGTPETVDPPGGRQIHLLAARGARRGRPEFRGLWHAVPAFSLLHAEP